MSKTFWQNFVYKKLSYLIQQSNHNGIVHKLLLNKFLRKPPNSKGPFQRRTVLFAVFAACGFSSTRELIRPFKKGTASTKAILEYLKAANLMDNIIDNLSPKTVLDLGQPKLGLVPSPFLLSMAEMWPQMLGIYKVVEIGLIDKPALDGLVNLQAQQLYQMLYHIDKYHRSKHIDHRKEMAEASTKLLIAHHSTIAHILRGKPLGQLSEQGVSLEQITNVYPIVEKTATLLRYYDDFEDLIEDARKQSMTGYASPNHILCNLSQKGISDQETYSIITQSNSTIVKLSSISSSLGAEIHNLENKYRNICLELPNYLSLLFTLMLDCVLQHEFLLK